tara:strand:- start:103 stop:222 length:120 start_codon:yes stop_codon:yes gene_type:complete
VEEKKIKKVKKKLDTYSFLCVYLGMKNDKKINKKGNKTI